MKELLVSHIGDFSGLDFEVTIAAKVRLKQRVLVHDMAGNSCEGIVKAIGETTITFTLDPETWVGHYSHVGPNTAEIDHSLEHVAKARQAARKKGRK